ncbi:DUF167 domain-containing protein [Candidatus Babeliales bacterium]|nr:DUF167 domain-containing protein [Candidatus Babeliales bacterium]
MEIRLSVKVTPNASRERILYDAQGSIKIYVMAPAVEGKANDALIKLCAKKLGVSKGSITILDGEKGRYKTLLLTTPFSQEKILQLLGLEQQDSLL